MIITRFEDIEAWQSARELCRAVALVISKGDFAKSFALKDQIDRGGVRLWWRGVRALSRGIE